MTGVLQRVRPRFDERNTVLALTLGLIASLRRFRTVLRRHGSPSWNARSAQREEFLLVLLGLISFSRSVMSCRAVGRFAADTEPAEPPSAPADHGGLLR
jgi:hypothetical protein